MGNESWEYNTQIKCLSPVQGLFKYSSGLSIRVWFVQVQSMTWHCWCTIARCKLFECSFSSVVSFPMRNSLWHKRTFFKVGLVPSKKSCAICFVESPLKMMKSAFCFILKALFVLKIFKFLSWLFVHVEKAAWLEG